MSSEGEVLGAQLAYWRDKLSGLPLALELPTDRPRPAMRRGRGALHSFALDPDTLAALRALSQTQDATSLMTLLSVFKVLLARYSGQDDIVVGTDDPLVLRTDLSGDPSFVELLARVREVCLGAYAHKGVPFERIVEELHPAHSFSRTPLFQVMFTSEGAQGGETALGNAPLDLTLSVVEDGDAATGVIGYDADLFEPATIARMAGHLTNLFTAVASGPGTPLSRLDMLDASERHRLTVELNDAAAGHPKVPCVHEQFEAHAQKSPDEVALMFGDTKLTYGELNESANRLAHHLIDLGVGPETLVGICLERGIDMIVGLVAILKAGGAYVPLDPDYPPDRLAYMLANTAAPVLVTHSRLLPRIPAGDTEVVCVDSDADEIAARPETNPDVALSPENLAYVIYTSGSTGVPKGGGVQHGSIASHCIDIAEHHGFTPADRMLVFSSFSFDLSVEETLVPLTAGASIFVRGGEVWGPKTFAEHIDRYGLTVANLPTAFWHEIADDDETVRRLAGSSSLRLMVVGGEKMQSRRVQRWLEACDGRLPLLNNYGPSEATIAVTSYRVRDAQAVPGGSIPIGRPIAKSTVYILDRHGNPVPIGVPGELYIGGRQVARGYVGRPALTAERFVPDPYSLVPGARLYRTGDRARHLADGNIELLGRVDHQVKIRGFRIEPGEIEACLRRHEAVRDALVLARDDGGKDKRLVAYIVVPDGAPTTAELRSYLLESLPDYMVPRLFVALDKFPLTPNRKIDRAALPAPKGRPEIETAYVAPRNATEEILTTIWCEVLGLEHVGVDDDFFELGGHSLAAIRVASLVRSALEVELSVTEVFGNPTVDLLAREIEAARRQSERMSLPAVEPASGDTPAPLSFQQEQMWFYNRLAPESIAYQTQTRIRVAGPLDVAVFRRAVAEVERRHEILRTSYVERDGRVDQIVHPSGPVAVTHVDLSDVPLPERAQRLDDLVQRELRTPFDLSRLPLMRWTILQLGSEEHEIVLVEHHIVHDGWSFTVLIRELTHLYEAFARGEESPLEELPIQYRDYARWQREAVESPAMQAQRAFWLERLAGISRTTEPPRIKARPPVQSFRGETIRVDLPDGLPAALRDYCLRERVTPFAVMFAAFAVLLQRYTGESDVTVASGFANRKVVGTERLIGMFVNPVLLRCDLDGDPPFRALARQVRDVVLDALRNQEFPFSELVRMLNPVRDPSRSPLLEVMFAFHDATLPRIDFAGASGTVTESANGSAKTDLNVIVFPGAESRTGDVDGMAVMWEYNADLLDAATANRLADHYATILGAVCAAPDARLSQLDMLGDDEHHHVTVELNDTSAGYPAPACMHELFAAQAAQTPDAVALIHGDTELSYQALNAASNRLAHHLVSLGVGPGTLVGICLERGVDMVVGLLAILKAGGAYVPLDPRYPRERLAFMLTDTGAQVLVTSSDLLAGLPEGDAALVLMDSDKGAIAARPATDPEITATADDLAYVIYTSGSTGTPQGVEIEHRSVWRFLHWSNDFFGRRRLERVWAVTSICFDLSVFELFAPLSFGGAVVVGEALTPPHVPVTLVNTVPSAMAAILEQGSLPPSALTVNLAGEPIPPALVEELFSQRPDVELFNLYGPSEDTTYSTYARIEKETAEPISIGRPIANTQVYLLDPYGNPVPTGIPGELYLGGAGLARGYLKRPALTAERFVPDPFSATPGARLYRTGDRARYLPNGNIEYLGRVDHQVKIRGFRIEPGEIEAALTRHEGLTDAVVIARRDGAGGDKRLVAYMVPRDPSNPPNTTELRGHLSESLPEHMIPAAFVVLDALPLTPNGKLDRAALPAPEGRPELAATYVAARTPAEEILASIWAEVLGVERVGINDNFFELGGDSILSMQIIARAHQAGLGLVPKQLFQHQTVAALAAVAGEPRAISAEQGTVTGEVPLTPIQRWFFELDLPRRHHFNQARLLSAPDCDPELIEDALTALVEHHDALRLRYTPTREGWIQHHAPTQDHDFFTVVDLSELDAPAQRRALLDTTAELQASLDLTHGPLLRAAYLDLGPRGARLFVCIHHLAVDGVSWRILLEDLETAYAQRASGGAVALAPKTTSFKQWAEHLVEYARSPEASRELEHWASFSDLAFELPLDHHDDRNDWASIAGVTVALTEAETRALLGDVPIAYRTRINDVLLAALADSLARFTGERKVVVDLEGHGREELFDDVDLTRTVGWFTSLFPVALEVVPGLDPGALLKGIKEQLRAVPARGLGYGVLRYLRAGAVTDRVETGAPVSFNYLGRFGQESGTRAFGSAAEAIGPAHAPAGERAHVIDVTGAVENGCLRLRWTYSTNLHEQATIEGVANDFMASLRSLIAHCTQPGVGGVTPSDFPLATLEQPTLDRLWAEGLVGRDTEDVYPLTPLQQGMVFHTLDEPDSGVYFQQWSYALNGPLDADAFAQAWRDACSAHDVLRSQVLWEGLRAPVQVVKRDAAPSIETMDLRDLDPAAQRRRVDEYRALDRARGFDLGTAPLMRLALFRTGPESWLFVWSFHHVLLDGWSAALLRSEVLSRYRALVSGVPPEIGRERPHRDYVAWLRGRDRAADERYWRDRLAGFTSPTPLPDDGDQGHGEPDRVALELDEDTAAALDALARSERVTLNTIVQGAWALLLARNCGEEDVVFGATVSGRPPELAGVQEMIGLFINTVPIRVVVDGTSTARSLLGHIQADALGRGPFEHSALTDIHSWSEVPGVIPLFESIVVFESYPDEAVSDATDRELTFEYLEGFERTNYPLTLVARPRPAISLEIVYDRGRIQSATVDRMAGHLRTILKAIASDPDVRLSELEVMGAPERNHMLFGLDDGAERHLGAGLVHELFEARVNETPNAVAVLSDGDELSYSELDDEANRLAHHLLDEGVGPEVPVGICLERGKDLVVCLLAIFKAGGAYVPLDPDYPAERLDFMLRDSGATVVLTDSRSAKRLPDADVQLVVLDEDAEVVSRRPATSPGASSSSQDLAYVIYTSGSTGTPKGVAVTYGSLGDHCAAMADRYALTPADRVLVFGSFNFDVTLEQTLTPLIAGASVVLRDTEVWHPGSLSERIAELGITLFNPPTAYWHQVATEREVVERLSASASLRLVAVGGEAMATSRLRRWIEADGGRLTLLNNYGPTEATITATSHSVAGSRAVDGDKVPIGRPIPNTTVYILDRYGNPVPQGVPGEIYIGGTGVARGYVNRAGLTAERFVPDPFSSTPGARLYRTGDRARYLAGGDIEFLGRFDHQVKVRGFRIEPGEVEARLVAHDGVDDAVVVASTDASGDKRLVAYFTALDSSNPPGPPELRRHVAESLPDHMVPAHFVALDELPLTPNGKVDRAALPAPDGRPQLEALYVAPRTPAEEVLAAIWSEVLELERVGVHDDFFELGGHSLLATQVVSRMRATLEVDARVKDVFEAPTVEGLARHVEQLIVAQVEALSDTEVKRELAEIGRSAPERGETT